MNTYILTIEVFVGAAHAVDGRPYVFIEHEIQNVRLETNDNGSAIFKNESGEIVALFNSFSYVKVKEHV